MSKKLTSRAGKHRKPVESLRKKPRTVWFTDAEDLEVVRRAGDTAVSTWLRDQILSLMAMP